MKICTKCNLEKSESEFNTDKKGKNGKCARCKSCTSLYNKLNYEQKQDHIKAKVAAHRVLNRDVILEKRRKEYHQNQYAHYLVQRAYRQANRELPMLEMLNVTQLSYKPLLIG
jgi:hypothetical protein